ncbi:MAG: NUDIX hydrolase [Collinsella sp.]|nr:NUDIX hydrolase [Collinsella sp.]
MMESQEGALGADTVEEDAVQVETETLPLEETDDGRGAAEEPPALVLGDEDPHDAELHERILSEEQVYRGKMLDVRSLDVELPNGRRSKRDIVRHPGAAAVVALTSTGKIVLVRQYRTALDRVTVEIPAGKLDPGEDPLECARRELHEETGFRPGKIRYLTSIVTSCGFCDEIIHIYFATQLEFDGASPDDDEFVNVDLVPLSELIDAVLDGKIEDAKTVVGALACDAIAHRLGIEE